MEQIHRNNAYVCFIFGTTLNLLLLLIILKKSPKELKVYSLILLQIVFIDFYYLCVTFLVEPVPFMDNGNICAINMGRLSGHGFSFSFNYALYQLWNFGTLLSLDSMPLQFFYRYMVVVRCFY